MRRGSVADLMLLVTVTLWALNFSVSKYILDHGFTPLTYSATRYGAAALIFVGIVLAWEGRSVCSAGISASSPPRWLCC